MEPMSRAFDTPPHLSIATPPQELHLRRRLSLSSRRDCIRLRGLPSGAEGDAIIGFLGEHARNIINQGVHIIYRPSGRPSGNAFVQMDSEDSAALAAACCHRSYIRGWRKLRSVKVYQCSMDDITSLGAVRVTAAKLLPLRVGPQLPYHGEPRLPVLPPPLPLMATQMIFSPITYLPYWSVPPMAQQLFNGRP